jgi:hypothetical protein
MDGAAYFQVGQSPDLKPSSKRLDIYFETDRIQVTRRWSLQMPVAAIK